MPNRFAGCAILILCTCCVATAQNQPGNNQQQQGGILVDAQGVVRKARKSKTISKKAMQAAAKKRLAADLNRPVGLRFVSLNRLEAECEKLLEAGQPLPDEVQFLAGLQRVDYIIVLEDTKEIVIGGPADGFAANTNGVMVGVNSGRPVLRLDDLLQAFKAVNTQIRCSFDPKPEKLGEVNRYLKSVGAANSVREARQRYEEMKKILGNQIVTINGVDPTSHFARTLVEADFLLKQISVGLQRSGVRGMKSYLDLDGAGTNSMRRWWFAPMYDALAYSEDRTVWRLSGQRVQLKAQDELVDDNGNRRSARRQNRSTATFQRLFTLKYPELAKRFDAFARLQNSFDLAIVAALIQTERLAETVDWQLSAFAETERFHSQKFKTPTEVPTSTNSRTANKLTVVGVVSGGVICRPRKTVENLKTVLLERTNLSLKEVAGNGRQGMWFWDRRPGD